jgi:hypothetical protein
MPMTAVVFGKSGIPDYGCVGNETLRPTHVFQIRTETLGYGLIHYSSDGIKNNYHFKTTMVIYLEPWVI